MLYAFKEYLVNSETGLNFFIWIRRNPLKNPDSTKGIQGNPRAFAFFY
jgi:hypothetical protein